MHRAATLSAVMINNVRRRPIRSEKNVTSSVPNAAPASPRPMTNADGIRIEVEAREIDAEQYPHHAGGQERASTAAYSQRRSCVCEAVMRRILFSAGSVRLTFR